MIKLVIGILLGIIVGFHAGNTAAENRSANDKAMASHLCAVPRASYGNWVAFDGAVWHCFIEHPDYPHKIKRSVIVQ